ncbi:hypothetical protein [Oryzifoliimicrobium ureilyticus]|uniref:hypothetical protein n=1 Tax=Oryzifoliimicrobium ureilyticus TaxID=3113724 RepID=UPI0030768117
MTIQSGSPAYPSVMEKSRAIDTPEFLTRIAQDMRMKSGSDLPLSCYVEQVKLQLASGKSPEELAGTVKEASNNNFDSCYRAWALGE